MARIQYSISLSVSEHEQAVKKASELGLSLSSYLRSLINADNIKTH